MFWLETWKSNLGITEKILICFLQMKLNICQRIYFFQKWILLFYTGLVYFLTVFRLFILPDLVIKHLVIQKTAAAKCFSRISGYSFFSSLLLALLYALINLLNSVLGCARNITCTWSISWFHSSKTITYRGAIYSHISFALSEIGSLITFLFPFSFRWSHHWNLPLRSSYLKNCR